ncbi:MAG TPA: LarC family nickel insertion protein, partial [Gammaproteobacteria bacterium]|nr:LarC family nickel insertion protein [Gammaproteobacteria bacterium]
CFAETTTLGVRWQLVHRAVLERSTETSLIDEHKVGLKHATRPDGLSTAKAEMDDLANAGDHKQREQLRRQVEAKSEH